MSFLTKIFKNWKYLALGALMLLGFSIRSYNLDFPSIGYHNMKENEYLSIAQEMQRTKDYVTRRIYFYNGFEDNPTERYYPQPPLISYQTLLSWHFLGDNLWGPRLINVLFGVAGILVIFFLAELLFSSTALALFCSGLLAVMPLAVFFSRNLQPESPGFFFMLLGNLFYLRFCLSLKKYNLLLGGAAFVLAWAYKFSFLIGIFPFIFCLPIRKVFADKRNLLKSLLIILVSYLPIALAIFWLKRHGQWEFDPQNTSERVRLLAIFTSDYWAKYGKMIWWYVQGENFTPVFTWLGFAGIAVALVKRKGLLNRYILGWVLSVVVYFMIFSDFVNQHNYYQMPFLVLACLAVCQATRVLSLLFSKVLKKGALIWLMAVILIFAYPGVRDSLTRMFQTVFYGVDMAGESLKEFIKPGERAFLCSYPQGQGIARYARRYVGWTDNLEDFKKQENKFVIRYVCFYPAELSLLLRNNNPALFNYIRDNYHLKEAGISDEPKRVFYVILEKGAGSKPEGFLESFSGNLQPRTIYKVLNGYFFLYSLRPPVEQPQALPEPAVKP